MKKTILPVLFISLFGALLSSPALAQWHRGPRIGFGINFGYPLYAPYYVPPPYYYYPPPAYYPPVAAPAPEYIERSEPAAPQASSPPNQNPAYWYYCAESKTYYPYVKECPGGWQRVAPQPPPG